MHVFLPGHLIRRRARHTGSDSFFARSITFNGSYASIYGFDSTKPQSLTALTASMNARPRALQCQSWEDSARLSPTTTFVMPTDSPPLQEDNNAVAGPSQTKGASPMPGGTAEAGAETHAEDMSSQEGSKVIDTQQQILDVLNRMYEEMQGQQHGEGTGPAVSGGPSSGPFKRKTFGINRQRFDQVPQLTAANEDYEKIFPEDAYGEEAGPNARIFRVYNEETTAQDNDIVGKSSDSSDVLLVFAGLFSAVLTTFVAQTSQALDTDKLAISNSLLSEIVQLQRAQANGTSLDDIPNAFTETTPTSNDVWVNGLWFTSLTLSLATALFAVLTKQWLRQYVTSTSGTIRDRSLIRQFRFAGLKKWHVIGIIGFLPILLHLSLGVFLAGLIVFLTPRCLPLAIIVGCITVIVFTLYLISNLIPIFNAQCPFQTPLSDILHFTFHWLQGTFIFGWAFFGHPIVITFLKPINRRLQAAFIVLWACSACTMNATCGCLCRVFPWVSRERKFPVISRSAFKTLRELEHAYVREESVTGSLSVGAIAWLMEASSNPSVHSVALQGVAGLPPSQRENVKNSIQPSPDFIKKLINENVSSDGGNPICLPQAAHRLERIVRICPIFDRERLGAQRMAYWYCLYTSFKQMDDIRGMASSLQMMIHHANNEIPQDLIASLIRDSPSLSPMAWANLFLELPRFVVSHLELLDICAKALREISGWKGPTWDGVTSSDPVSVLVALSRHPDLILSVFQNYNPFSSSLMLAQPDSLRLRALLTLHHFLETSQTDAVKSSSGKERDSLILLFEATWERISDVNLRDHTMKDCSAIFQAANICIAESSLLTGREWISSRWDKLNHYFMAILQSCCTACVHAGDTFGHHIVCKWGWKGLLDRIIKDVELVDWETRNGILKLWQVALDYDVQDAYSSFVSSDFFRHIDTRRSTASTRLVVLSFIRGLVRQHRPTTWNRRQTTEPKLLECLEYLHEQDNLLSACKAFMKCSEALPEDFLRLAQLEPTSDAWNLCRTQLRQWEVRRSQAERIEDALKALDNFFESRRRRKDLLRRLNPITLLRLISSHTDIDTDPEMQEATRESAASAHGLQDISEEHPVPEVEMGGSPAEPIQSSDHTDRGEESTSSPQTSPSGGIPVRAE